MSYQGKIKLGIDENMPKKNHFPWQKQFSQLNSHEKWLAFDVKFKKIYDEHKLKSSPK